MSILNRQRRIGERLGVQGLVVGWNTRDRRIPRWRHRPFVEADVIDVSVSGAQLLAPITSGIAVGTELTIAAGGALGRVRVRRIVPMSQQPLACYGIEFVELDPALEAMLFANLPTIGTPEAEVVWR